MLVVCERDHAMPHTRKRNSNPHVSETAESWFIDTRMSFPQYCYLHWSESSVFHATFVSIDRYKRVLLNTRQDLNRLLPLTPEKTDMLSSHSCRIVQAISRTLSHKVGLFAARKVSTR
ncbi:hypothetical protein TNCV_2055571 [Trichonephila clavipes]|nr:hypothetical protein TNCV_2055571 [Trichonephila clavipes]